VLHETSRPGACNSIGYPLHPRKSVAGREGPELADLRAVTRAADAAVTHPESATDSRRSDRGSRPLSVMTARTIIVTVSGQILMAA